MNKPLLATLATTLSLFAALPVAHNVEAATGIQRCQSPDGTMVYTDKACAAFGASSAPVSGELMTRILHEEARELATTGKVADVVASVPLPSGGEASRKTGGCAVTPLELQRNLASSLATRDVNRVAENYHWVGISAKASSNIMQRLERLATQSLAHMQYFDAQVASLASAGVVDASQELVASPGGSLQLHLATPGGTVGSVLDLRVERYAGCYFVQF